MGGMRKLTLAWWSCLLAFTWDARLYHRCRFLPVVVIKFGASPPRKRRTETHKPSRRKAREMRSCDHTMHSPAFSFYASVPRHAGWIGARRCADRRGLYFSLSADENERYTRGGVGCLALRRASEPARGATYPTRGSKLTETHPRARGCE